MAAMTMLRDRIGAAAGRLLDLALPAVCVGCGREGTPICDRCGLALRARAGVTPGVPIGMPSDVPAPLLQLDWCGPFNGVIRDALHAIKYRGDVRIAEPLGLAVAERWREAGAGGDLVVHVPVHPTRARERGYDQAERIARVVARELGLAHRAALVRARATMAQFSLDRAARATNVSGAFALANFALANLATAGGGAAGVGGRWVLLVDDVVTTGATLAACAEVLLASGAVGVSAVTVARER